MTDLSEADKEAIEPILIILDGDYEKFVKDESLRNNGFDLESMREIVALAKSQDANDRLKSLDLIGLPGKKYPFGFEQNLLIALEKDEDQRVQLKATSLQIKLRKDIFKSIDKELGRFGESYAKTFGNIASSINATSRAFSQSQEIARKLSDTQNSPIKLIDPEFLEPLGKSIEKILSLPTPATYLPSISPITAIQPLIQPILTRDKPELTIGEAVGKTPEEIASDLKKISTAEEENVFNYEGYLLLYNLERFLRDLIYKRICIPSKSNIGNKIGSDILDRWKDRREKEEGNPLMKKGYPLIDYSDFSDIKQILQKGKNKNEFSDVLTQEQFRSFVSKLDELDPIRRKIAHSRPLSKDEFTRLRMYANDIAQLFNQTESTPGSGE